MKTKLGELDNWQIEEAIEAEIGEWYEVPGEDEQVEEQMDSPAVKDLFREYLDSCGEWGNHGYADWTEDEYGDKNIDWDGPVTQREFENYVRCSIENCWGGFVTEDNISVMVEDYDDDYLRITFLHEGDKLDEGIYSKEKEIEVDERTIEVGD